MITTLIIITITSFLVLWICTALFTFTNEKFRQILIALDRGTYPSLGSPRQRYSYRNLRYFIFKYEIVSHQKYIDNEEVRSLSRRLKKYLSIIRIAGIVLALAVVSLAYIFIFLDPH